jgi:MarR family transcriptional regulator, organic hydroperoxide resistance regulator
MPQGSPRFVDDYLLYLLARTSHVISAEFHDRLRVRGVSVPVWRVLASLQGSATGETVTGLADLCLLQQPTMTKLLDRMVRDALVERAPDPRDRRVVRVQLTATGTALVDQLTTAARAHEAEVLARHPDAEPATLKVLLRAILDRDLRQRRG